MSYQGFRKGNKYKVFKTRAQISLPDGTFFIVDPEEVNLCKQYTWNSSGKRLGKGRTRDNMYIKGTGRILLHRLITKASPGEICDHIDGNFRNNRKVNLRFVTHGQNKRNSRSGKGLIPGVSYHSRDQIYQVRVLKDGKMTYFGSYKDKETAEQKCKDLKNKYYGRFSPHWNESNG